MEYAFTAKTMQGLEEVLADELRALGAKEVEAKNRAVSFKGNYRLLYNANYWCRTALHILKPVKEFDIRVQDDLYNAVREIPWEKMFSVDALLTIQTQCLDSVYTHSRYASQRVKDAIVDRFRSLFNQRPSIDNEKFQVRIDLLIKNNHCILSLDSSGFSLHRRGYRKDETIAPINEVLAAGLIALSGWDTRKTLYDPMCGSGTLAIEAAMMASNLPAAFYRKSFAFQYWNDYDPNLWSLVKQDALKKIKDPDCEIFASDIDPEAIQVATSNLKFAKLHHDVILNCEDFFQTTPPRLSVLHRVGYK